MRVVLAGKGCWRRDAEVRTQELGVPFINVSAPSVVSGMSGESEKTLRDTFDEAKKAAPCLLFIDEIDAIATKRFDAQTGADREVQRILLELLNQMDGFDSLGRTKLIMATNRPDTLDPAYDKVKHILTYA